MNKENISPSGQGTADQIAEYERRLKRISDQKSQLQLYADLINKLSMAKGLDKVSNRLVSLLMETLGGTNITLFYTINGTWHSIDAFGTASLLNSLIDAAVCQASIQKEILFIDDKTDTRFLENSQAGGFQYGTTCTVDPIGWTVR
ncbi:MAG: hypothetical protein M0T82_10710 [Desulfobacteraceae bacterium]|nr:hypothetical protein [Desulfobacteraceae bacterium]